MIRFDEEHEPEDLAEAIVLITVPEEFLGSSIKELTDRQGVVTSLEQREGNMVVRGSLRRSQLDSLIEAIQGNTLERGKVQQVDN